MEIICMEKQTFDELVVRLSLIEKKVIGLCSQTKDAGLKKWMDNQEVCGVLRISKKTLQVYREKGRYIARKDCCLSPGSRTSSSISRKMYKACWNQVITHKKESHELRSYKQKRPEN